jgi:hypothetical protein
MWLPALRGNDGKVIADVHHRPTLSILSLIGASVAACVASANCFLLVTFARKRQLDGILGQGDAK